MFMENAGLGDLKKSALKDQAGIQTSWPKTKALLSKLIFSKAQRHRTELEGTANL